jgi:hypothetical protein
MTSWDNPTTLELPRCIQPAKPCFTSPINNLICDSTNIATSYVTKDGVWIGE